ncbi:MAG: hypothetical protein KGL39_03360 [Patescibacteria group bacterium]|nr:hypothetical protein [Patescibacteria group bacterium]
MQTLEKAAEHQVLIRRGPSDAGDTLATALAACFLCGGKKGLRCRCAQARRGRDGSGARSAGAGEIAKRRR